MTDALKFSLGDTVYHKVAEDHGMVTGILFRPIGVIYKVTWPSGAEVDHYEMELSTERIFSNAEG